MAGLSLLAGSLLSLGSICGCAPIPPQPSDQEQKSGSAEVSSRHGGSLTISTISDPKSFNPIVAKETSTTGITGLIFEGLTRTNGETTEVEPGLGESWDISEDGLRWFVHLRQDAVWSDGQPFTAEDVAFTYNELIYNPDIPSTSRDIFTLEGKVIAVKALDAHTVEFVLPVPFAPFLRALGQEILPAHKLRPAVQAGTFASAWGLDTPPSELVATGPFLLESYTPGQAVRLRRNPHYWRKDGEGKPLPYLAEIRFQIVQSQDVELLKFKEGELDVYGLRGSDYALLKPEEAQGNYTVYEVGPAFSTNFVCFNQHRGINPATQQPFLAPHKQRWFTDVAFRRAVAQAIDRQSIITIVMNGLGYPQHAAMSPSAGYFYNENVPKYGYDLERARSLLAEAGYVDRDNDGVIEDAQGVPVEFTLLTNAQNNERVQIANIIRKDLEELGMRVHFNQLEFNNLVAKMDSTHDWDTILLGLTGGIEPHFGKTVWHSSGHLHMWHPLQESPATEWEAEIDRIFEAGGQELDPAKRKEFYDRWQVIIAEQAPMVYTVLPASIIAVRNRFGNLKPTPYGGALHNIDELYVTDGR